MATSSIFDNIVINDPKAIIAYVNAMEKQAKGPFQRKTFSSKVRMATKKDIQRIFNSTGKGSSI